MSSTTELHPGHCKEEPQEKDDSDQIKVEHDSGQQRDVHDSNQQQNDQESDQIKIEHDSNQQKDDQESDQIKVEHDSNQQKDDQESDQPKNDQESVQIKNEHDSDQQKDDSNEQNDRGLKRKLEEEEELEDKYLQNKKMKEVRIEMRCLIPTESVQDIAGAHGMKIKMLARKYHSELKILCSDTRECILLVTASPRNFGELVFKLVPCMNMGESRDNMELNLLVHHSQVKHIIEGDKIKNIQEKFGASIEMKTERMPRSTDQLCSITGTNKAINKCAMRVAKMLVHKDPPEGRVANYNPGSNKEWDFEIWDRRGARGFVWGPGPLGPRGDFFRPSSPRGGFFRGPGPRGGFFRGAGGPRGGPFGGPRGFGPRGDFFGGPRRPRGGSMRARGRGGFAPRGSW